MAVLHRNEETMNVERKTRGVVVGYDGSANSVAAVRWAEREAGLRNVPLGICHAWEPYMSAGPMTMPVGDLSAAAKETLAEGIEVARGYRDVHAVLEIGGATSVLMSAGAGAELLVVGSRGRGGFAGVKLGSVAMQLAAHAPGLVVVVRERPETRLEDRTEPVVVGVDGSAPSLEALGTAFTEANLHGTDLVVLTAWPAEIRAEPAPLIDARALHAVARQRLDELVQPWHEKFPAVDVRTDVVTGPAREVLLGAAENAGLLVVGSRGLGGVRGLLLGSVGHALLHHAPCSVAIAHANGRP
jgi:nucleotide-binding universal stress UspA family protein